MSYSIIGILALLVLIIVNRDILFNTNDDSISLSRGSYRLFLLCVMAFYICDFMWGIFGLLEMHASIYLDTVVFFSTMALCVLMWTRYVVAYLDVDYTFKKVLVVIGWVLFAFQQSVVMVNLFTPILFHFDENGAYHTGWARYITFGVQMLMYIIVSLYMFYISSKTHGGTRQRHLTIGFFGITMTIAIGVQELFPLSPFFSMGYMLGTCVLHSFVVEAEKYEYRKKLEELVLRERKQKQELVATRHLAYTDALTGVKSKHAYVEAEMQMDMRIAKKEINELALGLFDLNDLKLINDTLGHETGDAYIVSACKLICKYFSHSPVYRIGGDEFVVLIEGEDYNNRHKIFEQFNKYIDDNNRTDKIVVAAGSADYIPGRDNTINSIFKRADENMYQRKKILKYIKAEY